MTGDWVIAVPFKPAGLRKTRLADLISETERDEVADAMFRHVLAVLSECPGVQALPVCRDRPTDWPWAWHEDLDGELNAALMSAWSAFRRHNFAVVHADLPYLCVGDVMSLLDGAQNGCSLAPDRKGIGTNAVAFLANTPVAFTFGVNSFASFMAIDGPSKTVVRSFGLSFDLDTPKDYGEWLKGKATAG